MFAHSHRRHIKGIVNIWSFAEIKLRRHVGIRRSHFVRYWEMELRFNHRHEDLLFRIGRLLKKLSQNWTGSMFVICFHLVWP